MREELGFFNFSINKVLSKEQSFLDQARIRLLYYGLFLVFVTSGTLLASVYFQGQLLLAYTSGFLMFSVAVLFKMLTYRPNWRVVSHVLLIIGTLINVSIVYISLQNVNIVTIQVVIIVIVFGYYMLGQKWGLIYSLLNTVPILLFLVMEYYSNYVICIKPNKIDQATMVISLFANFILLIFIHSHFYNAFIKNFRQLKTSIKEQAALNLKLEKAIDKAEKSTHAKSEFLSTMSHEIRTPLNAVIGMSNLLMMGSPKPEQKENLEILKFSANNLLAIVNDVLDFDKIESGKLVFENVRFNLVELMNNICGGHILKAHEKGLQFELTIDDSLKNKVFFGDPTRITQVVFNLVSNAVKFTSQGSVWVKVTCLEDRHNKVTVKFLIKDTGIGIKEANMSSIFEPFTQESLATTREYEGTGLGLAIVKRLLELQGLCIKVTSTIAEGSEFSFNMELPVSTAVITENITKQVEETQENYLTSLKVLVAEDNMVNVMLMKKLLSKWKIIPTIAENGERAVEFMQYGNFDIILMDLQMPVMNGFDAANEIRKMADPKKANVPIIALTASAMIDIKDKIHEAGMNGYVSKPFRPNELFERIRSLIALT
ncbi:ATP-binding protein [Mucilaginibacter pocheonensis]|uniref:histidine kinase n=1 Tax=Mucilaginibacter pocheonensis TaxID=398050 RepID=A0ABU1TJ60_9SPHI|nr:ATP-binding protein [Mucilaginibacter pocheonensis]MDR6944895.1 signal transduction histidine kinase/CheY-like chemotaxis protein [Mucilaginibacter pocheonensis]